MVLYGIRYVQIGMNRFLHLIIKNKPKFVLELVLCGGIPLYFELIEA